MRKKQKVADMAEEVLARQAPSRAERTGESFEDALQAVLDTDAGEQLRKLHDGPHRHERPEDWQTGIDRERAVAQAVVLGVPPSSEDSDLPADGRKQERPG